MNLYIIRHGETDVNVEEKINGLNEIDLNKKGVEQAKNTGQKLKNIEYDFIMSSPLIRTKHTAELINVKNKKIVSDDRLKERDAGLFTLKYIKEIDPNDWWSINPKKDYQTVETVINFLNKLKEFLDEIKEKYKDKNIIIVTHGGTSKAISCYFKGIPKSGNIEKFHHDNCEIIKFKL